MYKQFTSDDIHYIENDVNKSDKLYTSSAYVKAVAYHSGSSNEDSSSYYHSINQLFYKIQDFGGSATHTGKGAILPYSENSIYPMYKNKFNEEGVLFSISQSAYGEKIKPGSLVISGNVDLATSNQIIIKDDGYGNLYPSNADITQSGNTSLSSSDNYVGNVFYEHGIAILTETASYISNTFYTSSNTHYEIEYQSTVRTRQLEYDCRLNANEYNSTSNPTILSSSDAITCNEWGPDSRRFGIYTTTDGTTQEFVNSGSVCNITEPIIASQFRTLDWQPYVTTIGLFNEHDEMLMIAKFPQPIRKLAEQSMLIKVKLDF